MHVLEQALLAVWRRTALCHDGNEDEDVDEEDEDVEVEVENDEDDSEERDDHDLDLLDSASECCIELAGTLGEHFVPYFNSFLSHVIRYTRSSNHHAFRALALGSIAEMIKRMDIDLSTHASVNTLVSAVYKGLSDPFPDVQRTAAFLCGVLLQHTPSLNSTTSGNNSINIAQILGALHPLFDSRREAVVIDNACGAVARIISTSPHTVPFQHVLPVLLSALPLREDHEEDKPVWTCFMQIVASSPDLIAPHCGLFLAAVAKSWYTLPEDLTTDIAASVKRIGERLGTHLDTIAASLPHDMQQTLHEIVNKR